MILFLVLACTDQYEKQQLVPGANDALAIGDEITTWSDPAHPGVVCYAGGNFFATGSAALSCVYIPPAVPNETYPRTEHVEIGGDPTGAHD